MRLTTKDHRWGITHGKHFLKLQLGKLRFYISVLPMKPKYESKLRRGFRREILKRCSSKCEICGKELTLATLSVHLIKPRNVFPELIYDHDNCQALCSACHRRLHGLPYSDMPPMVSVPCHQTANDLVKALANP